MTIWQVHTNEGVVFCQRKPTKEQMFAYIRAKRAKGYSFGEIIYCWGPVSVRRDAP